MGAMPKRIGATPMITPQQFIAKWGRGGPAFDLNEEQGAQSHFLDLCELPDEEILQRLLALNLERASPTTA